MIIMKSLTKESWKLWLSENVNHEGIWIQFEKNKDTLGIKPEEALDVALCYGWIDGVMKKVDEVYYIKYFTKRRPKSIWSTKNKASIERLIQSKEMTEYGLKVIEIAKKNGQWEQADNLPKGFDVNDFLNQLIHYPQAYENYIKMSPSTQKIYQYYYFSAKRDDTKAKRFNDIINRLEQNLKFVM